MCVCNTTHKILHWEIMNPFIHRAIGLIVSQLLCYKNGKSFTKPTKIDMSLKLRKPNNKQNKELMLLEIVSCLHNNQ